MCKCHGLSCFKPNSDTVFAFYLAHCRDLENHLSIIKYFFTFFFFFCHQKNEFDTLANAKILLSDCLACDSCMTLEEGARVFQQNQKEFFRVLNLNKVK